MGPISDEWRGYVRVSTEDQADHGVSLEAQREALAGYAMAHGLLMPRIIADEGLSSKTLDRPGIVELVGFLDAGGKGIVVTKYDRLTRSLRDWCDLVYRYFGPEDGPSLLSVWDGQDLKRPAGRMTAAILMAVSEHLRENIVEGTNSAVAHKRSLGHRLGTVPYGWMVGDDGKTLVACDEEVKALTMMRNLAARKMTIRVISQTLDDLGFRARNGQTFAPSTISKLLREEARL